MANYSTSEFKSGLKLLLDGDPCSILEADFVKPGKGQAFVRVKYRNLKNGRVLEKTFRSGESVEGADVMEIEVQYLYDDGSFLHFMDPNSYEQYSAGEAVTTDAKPWLKPEDKVTLTLWNGTPILVEPPKFAVLTVAETEPSLKGDTVSGGSKSATLETGAVVRVPLFVEKGELIKVDTRTASYVSRAKSA